MSLLSLGLDAVERGLVPDPITRAAIRQLCRQRLQDCARGDDAKTHEWMGRYFFTGGLMPSETMLRQFDRHMSVVRHWSWDGTHYQRTSEAWLANLDAHRRELLPVLERTYGRESARRWFHRWRMFFLAVAEVFGYAQGTEWFVSHSLLQPNGN